MCTLYMSVFQYILQITQIGQCQVQQHSEESGYIFFYGHESNSAVEIKPKLRGKLHTYVLHVMHLMALEKIVEI